MYQFFPKKRLVNVAPGFYSLPLKKGEDGQYHVNMAITPFFDMQRDVISCTDEKAIDRSYAVPLESFTLMKGPDSWLAIREKDGTINAGLLPGYVNRGDEQRELSSAFMGIDMKDDTSQKGLALMGYMVSSDRIVFLARVSFDTEPSFYSKARSFIKIGSEEMFTSFLKHKRLGRASKEILTSAADLYASAAEEIAKEEKEHKERREEIDKSKVIDLERA